MEKIDPDSPLAIAAQEFLESRKHSHNLTNILNALEDGDTTSEAIIVSSMIFLELLQRRSMLLSSSDDKNKSSSVSEHVAWLRNSYNLVWKKLAKLMTKEDFCEDATNALFVLLAKEGKFPIDSQCKRSYYFPEKKFQIILEKYFSVNANFPGVHNQFDEFTNYIDVAYYFWLNVPKILEKIPKNNEKLVSLALDILRRIPIPSEHELTDINDDLMLCFTKSMLGPTGLWCPILDARNLHNVEIIFFSEGKARFKPKYVILQKCIQNVWNIILGWNCQNSNHKKALVLLLEAVLPHLFKPILTMDYLMDSLNAGGVVSLLALEGVFAMVRDHNLEYPNIYEKLYSFFHPSLFHTKYKNRLYALTNTFLSSTHLPEMLIASFIKRFSRMCLQAPPQDIIILSAFIKNLLIRHPTLKMLIHCSNEKSVSADPFIEDENNPYKTKAMESSLWELETLQHHILPKVSRAVSFINKTLPNAECDFLSLIDGSLDKTFELESRKKFEKVSLTFEKPTSLALPRTSYFTEMFDPAA